MPYRIRDWSQHFERDRSKQWKHLEWVPIPNKQGSGYRRIMSEKSGLEIFACWVALVEVASTCTPRGDLTKYGIPDLARMTLISEGQLSKAIVYLSHTLDWIEDMTNLDTHVKILDSIALDTAIDSSIQFNSLNSLNSIQEGDISPHGDTSGDMLAHVGHGDTMSEHDNIYKSNPEHRACSELLRDRVLQRKQALITDATLKAWDNEVRLMIKRDGRTVEQIKAIINECHDMPPQSGTGFTWANNILSMAKLREQWNAGKIAIKMNAAAPPKPPPIVSFREQEKKARGLIPSSEAYKIPKTAGGW